MPGVDEPEVDEGEVQPAMRSRLTMITRIAVFFIISPREYLLRY
jgi:hypothetical protein